MSYMHIENLYKCQDVLLFRELYALEKIHGTSTDITWRDGRAWFSSGGAKAAAFRELFAPDEKCVELFTKLGHPKVTIYGEAYGGGGGAGMKMSHIYGPKLKFVAFEVEIGDVFLSVPQAEDIVRNALGLEFVHYDKISSHLADLDGARDAPSVQAKRNGFSGPREGVVLRPLIEVRKNNGHRIIAKHKGAGFEERATPPKVVDPEQLKVLTEADSIADEWVTPMRLTHVLDKLGNPTTVAATPKVIEAMVEDVLREAKGEIVDSKEARRAISKKAAGLFRARTEAES